MRQRGIDDRPEPMPKKTAEERENQRENFVQYVLQARRECEEEELEQCRETENALEDHMKEKFGDEYVPMKHHLMNYQVKNLLKEHSKLTPQNEKSKFHFYLGGEGQTEDQISGIKKRKSSSAKKQLPANVSDDSGDELQDRAEIRDAANKQDAADKQDAAEKQDVAEMEED